MPDHYPNKLQADSAFEKLIQPYSDNELNEIIAKYKNQPTEKFTVDVWNNTLLISAYLYQKITDEEIAITLRSYEFSNKLEAIVFVCMKQLERKDLTESYYKYLVGQACLTDHFRVNCDKNVSKLQSAMKIAAPLSLAAGTVLKYSEYAKALDSINITEPKLAEYILNERVKLSHNNMIELARIPKENLKQLLDSIEKNGLKKITYSDMRFETQYNPPKGIKQSKVIRTEEKDEKLAIRQVPTYDPDAQVSSLALTVPSWTSSINRVTDATDFSKISNAARNRLMRNLTQLNNSIEQIKQAIEEEI